LGDREVKFKELKYFYVSSRSSLQHWCSSPRCTVILLRWAGALEGYGLVHQCITDFTENRFSVLKYCWTWQFTGDESTWTWMRLLSWRLRY